MQDQSALPTQAQSVESCRYDPSWHLTLETTKGTLLEIPDLFPLINSFNSVGVLKKEYEYKYSLTPPDLVALPFGPWGIAITRNGTILVVNHSGGTVAIYDRHHKYIKSFPDPNKMSESKLSHPIGIALDKTEENIYIAEYGAGCVSCYNREGNKLRTWSKTDKGNLSCPYDIVVDFEGNVAVADAGNSKIQVYTPEGQWIRCFSAGVGPDQLACYATGLKVDKQGNIVVLDSNSIRILNSEGKNLKMFKLNMSSPFSLDIDGKGNFIVADYSGSCVRAFTPEGEVIMDIGKAEVGSPQLQNVESVAIDRHGNLLITEMGSKRVSVWG